MKRRGNSNSSRQNRREREYVQFLRWLESGPKPWLEPHMRRWRDRYGRGTRRADMGGIGRFFPSASYDNEEAYAYALKKAFYYVKRLRYVNIENKGNEVIMTLTDQGRRQLLGEALRGAPKLTGSQKIVVLFDIPEQKRKTRDVLRYFLREHGFRQLQLSAWMTDRDCFNELQILVRSLGIEKWVTIIRGLTSNSQV